MNSKQDKKYIVSYFCILLLLCSVRTIGSICCDGTLYDRMGSFDLNVRTDRADSKSDLTDGALISSRIVTGSAAPRGQYLNAVSAPVYSSWAAFRWTSSISLAAVIITVMFTIIAARHLLC